MSEIDWSLIILALIGMCQVLGLALIQRGRRADKVERAVVAEKVEHTAIVAAETQDIVKDTNHIAKETHQIANSRYDELRDELRKSNERVIALLQQRDGRVANAAPPASGIVAAPEGERRKP